MGGRTGKYFGEQARANYSANSAELKQAQKHYQSKAKFGKTATRIGGLSQAEIGEAPTMQYSKGFLGDAERNLSPELQAMSPRERQLDKQERKRARLGFGAATQLG